MMVGKQSVAMCGVVAEANGLRNVEAGIPPDYPESQA